MENLIGILFFVFWAIALLHMLTHTPSDTRINDSIRDRLPKNPTREDIINAAENQYETKRRVDVQGGAITAGLGHGLFVLRDRHNTPHIICGAHAKYLAGRSYSKTRGTMRGGGETISGVSPFDLAMMQLSTFNISASYDRFLTHRGGMRSALNQPLEGIACEKPCCTETEASS